MRDLQPSTLNTEPSGAGPLTQSKIDALIRRWLSWWASFRPRALDVLCIKDYGFSIRLNVFVIRRLRKQRQKAFDRSFRSTEVMKSHGEKDLGVQGRLVMTCNRDGPLTQLRA